MIVILDDGTRRNNPYIKVDLLTNYLGFFYPSLERALKDSTLNTKCTSTTMKWLAKYTICYPEQLVNQVFGNYLLANYPELLL